MISVRHRKIKRASGLDCHHEETYCGARLLNSRYVGGAKMVRTARSATLEVWRCRESTTPPLASFIRLHLTTCLHCRLNGALNGALSINGPAQTLLRISNRSLLPRRILTPCEVTLTHTCRSQSRLQPGLCSSVPLCRLHLFRNRLRNKQTLHVLNTVRRYHTSSQAPPRASNYQPSSLTSMALETISLSNNRTLTARPYYVTATAN